MLRDRRDRVRKNKDGLEECASITRACESFTKLYCL
jgi:hypothetical protein